MKSNCACRRQRSHAAAPASGRAARRAYWQDGRDIGDVETLVQIAVEQGFDEQAARDELANGELRETIIGLEAHAQQVGVTGVPFFIVDGKLAVSGAQTPDVWAEVFAQVLQDAA